MKLPQSLNSKVVASALAGLGASMMGMLALRGWMLPGEWGMQMVEAQQRHILLFSVVAIMVALSIGVFVSWRHGNPTHTRRMVFITTLGTLLAGAGYNLIFFQEVESKERFQLVRHSKESLSDMIVRSPGEFEGIDLLLWLKRHASGSLLHAGRETMERSALVPHRLLAVAGVRFERTVEPTQDVLQRARSAAPDSTHWPAITTATGSEIRMDPRARGPNSTLCAWRYSDAVILITDAERSVCAEAAP